MSAAVIAASHAPVSVTDVFNAPGSWVVPAGVTSFFAEAVGNGGGGGPGSAVNEGGGGGGGAYAADTFACTPGDTWTITDIAAALGASGANGSFGANGLNVKLKNPSSTTVLQAGGGKGTAAFNPAGGAGGLVADCIGATKTAGSAGDSGAGFEGKGGDAAPPIGGPGGAVATTNGLPGTAPGGGGSGGNQPAGNAGGNGALGRLQITYTI